MIERNEQGQVVRVELHNIKITDSRLVNLKGMARLTYPDLMDTKITDGGLVHTMGLTKLQTLKLYHCEQITDAGAAELQKAWPKCKIEK